MDNVTHAIFLAFAMFALVLGLSYGLYLLGNMNSVASTLISATDATRDYEKISYNSKADLDIENAKKKRIVGLDTVISTIYRYNQESYSVEIYDRDNKLMQIFDLTVEGVLNSNDTSSQEYKGFKEKYGDLSGAPWNTNNDYIQQRIDMYVSSQKGYINNKEIDYSKIGLASKEWLGDNPKFSEQFIQYTYDGETISDSKGHDVESITGSRRAQNKILIIYKLQ